MQAAPEVDKETYDGVGFSLLVLFQRLGDRKKHALVDLM